MHGWDGSITEPMIAWLGEQGKALGFETTVVEMPGSHTPTIGAWVSALEAAVMYPDESTHFIGHSIGFQAIVRYLQSPEIMQAGAVIGIAPWLTLTGLHTEEDKDIARPWLENPIDFSQIKKVVKESILIFSDNDEDVPLKENQELFQAKLSPKMIVEHNKGHFTEGDGVKDLQVVVEELKRFA